MSTAKLVASLERGNSGSTTLVTVGPLTNATTALHEDFEAFRQLRKIVMMGATV